MILPIGSSTTCALIDLKMCIIVFILFCKAGPIWHFAVWILTALIALKHPDGLESETTGQVIYPKGVPS